VGEGAEREHLQRRAATERIDNVAFLPAVPVSEVGSCMAACDLLLVPLKNTRNTGATIPSKIFTIAAAGRPFIFTGEGVGAELVHRYDAGLVVPPGDAEALASAIIELCNDRELGKRLGANGLRLASDFDRDRLALEMLANLREVAKR
jgi:glycosyltransferase involved in cell wall biosynthesis